MKKLYTTALAEVIMPKAENILSTSNPFEGAPDLLDEENGSLTD